MDCVCKGEFRLGEIYVVGENRPITLRASDKNTASFAITDAEYRIKDRNKEIVASGRCEIDNTEHTMMFYFNPQTAGTYTITFIVTIPPIVRKIDLVVRVRAEGEGESELIKPWQ